MVKIKNEVIRGDLCKTYYVMLNHCAELVSVSLSASVADLCLETMNPIFCSRLWNEFRVTLVLERFLSESPLDH
jgi:hypothetical protein